MFANCWQVVVSLLYVQYNALVTAFLVGEEWSRFACADFNDHLSTKELASSTRISLRPVRDRSSSYLSRRTTNQVRRWCGPPMAAIRRSISFVTRAVRPWMTPVTVKLRAILVRTQNWLSPEPEPRVRKTLRVSAPEGIQRSSYFVSMPWKYGIPLISSMSVLHWLISQSVFVYVAEVYKADGTLDTDIPLVTGTGFSLEPTICCK